MILKRFNFRYYFQRVKNLEGNPHSIALGMAIGVFVGLTPTIPFHTIVIILATTLFRCSRLAGIIAGTLVCNPFTIPVIYYLSYRIGKWTFSSGITLPNTYSILTIAHAGWELLSTMLMGGLVLGLVPALLSYFGAFYSFRHLASRRDKMASINPR